MLMIPFDLGHFQKTVDQIECAAVSGVARRRFILSDVPALKSACTVHRREPSGYVTEEFECPPNDCGPQLTPFIRPATKSGEHFADKTAMVQFILFNFANCLTLIRRADRMPMTAICIGGRQFT